MKMRFIIVCIVLCAISDSNVFGLSSNEIADVQESCCTHGQAYAMAQSSVESCQSASLPEGIEDEARDACITALSSCCQEQFKDKEECEDGIKQAESNQCNSPKSDIGKTCCSECAFGRLTGGLEGEEGCSREPAEEFYTTSSASLMRHAFYQCCMESKKEQETTTEKKESTTAKAEEKDKYINECAESTDDLCTAKDTVCHNTNGSYKCVPIKKREAGSGCPPGFKKNVINQVCDDINECQLPRPPCPKYLCENTIGGYKCAGKPGKPFAEDAPGPTTAKPDAAPEVKNDICPPGFRAGEDDECLDIDECEERVDDCQRLSQHCINTHGGYFCQDHVSKRCAPGFKVNSATGICEDIDECVESLEVCKRTEVCVNLPGAYNCKSKISTLPKLAPTKKCQEGTRLRPGGSTCEDIDECREGSHLCDQFQNCINTFGGHECRCKNGFELDSSSSSCVDIDECALKLDNCQAGQHCLNILGSFTCTQRAVTTSTSTTLSPDYYYEYYESGEDDSPSDPARAPSPGPAPTPETTPSTTSTTSTTSSTTTSTTTTTTTTLAPTTSTPPPTTSTSTTTTSTTTPRPRPYQPPRRNHNLRPRPRSSTTTTEQTRFYPSSGDRPDSPPGTGRRVYNRRPQFYPRRPTSTTPVETTVTTSTDINTIERDRAPDGSYAIDTGDIPKDKWTNVIEKESEPEFDPSLVHCLNGFERNERGECVDVNECDEGRHICSTLEYCKNRPGGYECVCVPGFTRDVSGWCAPITPTRTTPTTPSTTTSTTSTTTTARPTTSTVAYTYETESTSASTTPEWGYPNSRWIPPQPCDQGYTFSSSQGRCVDVDECATNRANCSPKEDCVNTEGGYRCVCGRACRGDTTYESPPVPDSNVITVGAQYGRRGPRYMRPTRARLPGSGAIVTTCPWGYKLTPDKHCLDIDECARNVSECGPQQKCENFFGGYSCQCPTGHRLNGKQCDDIDECNFGNPCSYNARCINTVGSYRCACGAGFRNAPSNDKVCVDVDECAETPVACEHGCSNVWGGYRCFCNRGYRLRSDNRTCEDIDECSEWGNSRTRGRLCGGRCVNTAGSFRCACPTGYRLADDERSCIDIDECETGEAQCGAEAGSVCQNTRGGFHCHHIRCPPGYRLEGKHKCSRIQRSCLVSDWNCLQQPSTYSYNFITFVSNIYLPMGSVDLFTMHGPSWQDSVVNFEMRMIEVQASPGVKPADLSCFDMRPSGNICVVSLVCSLGGPQVAELELTMSLYQRALYAGSAVARLVVIVSEYDF
ncbi:latent-transforming growth factor beta-binding protein 4-like isoform X2 [Zerene cesonia]|uniref:latent-transforming growth factor beta-binding protein 4-like isoform X2 n=1 Tax=Zerene cesonia TaxID=33412 RepID=UPI0018E56432|nr:latent-transforming growth factor beta-binding protein 4-like isoform X2 [Zerene cesonia]